jgi:hypothetical protein
MFWLELSFHRLRTWMGLQIPLIDLLARYHAVLRLLMHATVPVARWTSSSECDPRDGMREGDAVCGRPIHWPRARLTMSE